jgi:hypothetical protein
MRIPLALDRSPRQATFGPLALASILAACSHGATPPIAASNSTMPLQNVALARIPVNFSRPPDRRNSWMDAAAAKGALLYVSDSLLGDVFAFTWPKLRLIGNLSGLHFPQGECADASGNIWIANTKRSEMVEFAHGGVKPIKTLSDRGQYPSSCSINSNGDLAVANILSKQKGGYGSGDVGIYRAASGRPKIFADPDIVKVFFDGYDARGNVFVDGQDASGAFAIAEFNGKSFVPLTVSGATINAPGAIQVTGAYVNVEDQLGSEGNSVMYRTKLRGTTLNVEAAAQLYDGTDCVGSYIEGAAKRQRLICPNGGSPPSVNVYRYPAGGSPLSALYKYVYEPSGAVISDVHS